MKICLISPVPPPYGGISHWTKLIHRLAQTHPDLEFLQIDTAPRWRRTYDYAGGKRLLGGGLQLIRDYLFFLISLTKQPDLIHLTTSGSYATVRDLLITATARFWRVPIIYHIRFGRVSEIAMINSWEWRLMSKVIKLANLVLAITPDTAETIRHYIPRACVEYIPNPIDLSKLPELVIPHHRERYTALYLGWIVPAKGIEDLIQAWSELSLTNWELLLVGPGDPNYQETLINRFHPHNLKFMNEFPHDDAMKLLASSDIFLFPSYTEGFPNVILEAMALGKPIVATNVGAIPDMLSKDCGLLVNPRDGEALKSSILSLVRDEKIRYELGMKAYRKVRQKYSSEIIFTRYLEIWRNQYSRR